MSTELQKTENSIEKMDNAPTVAPWMDIYESDDAIVMLADMPGVNEKDLELKFENNGLAIKGTQTPYNENFKPLFREVKPLKYERTFKLPSGLEVGKIRADLSDGLLTITLPKSEEEKPHTIKINRK